MPKADGKTLTDRICERYKVDSKTKCWNWTAGKNSKGYAYIWTGPRRKGDTHQVHKIMFVLKFGPVPAKLELHHKCENPKCINPDHLELLTHAEHQRKHKNNIATKNAIKTHCKRGHIFDNENTYLTKAGGRLCRVCASLRMAKVRAQRKVG